MSRFSTKVDKRKKFLATLTLTAILILGLGLTSVPNVSATPQETIVVAGDSSGKVFALGVPSGSLLWSVEIGGDTRSVVVSDNNQYILVGTSDGIALLDRTGLVLWTKTIGVNPTHPTPPFQSDTKLVSISRDGSYMIVAHNDSKVRLYNNAGMEIWNDEFSANSVAISSNGKSAVVGGSGGIRYYSVGANDIWDSSDSSPAWKITYLSIRKVAISSKGDYVVTGDRSQGYARLYSGNGLLIWNYYVALAPLGYGLQRISVDISRDGKSIVAGNDDGWDTFGAQLIYFSIGADGNAGSWSAADDIPIWNFSVSPASGQDDVRAVAFSLDGRYIVSGGAGGYSHTFLHKIESSTPLFQSTPWGYEDETIDVSIDGRYIVAADSEMNAVRLYDTMDNTEPLWTYYADNKVRSVAILNPRSESVETATGSGIAILSSSSGSIESLVPVAEETLPTKGKPNAKFPYGFFSFNITGLEPHETVNLTITLPSSLPAGSHYWKYQNGNWFELPMGDDDGDETITIQLTDGGLGDADGVANGEIVDVGGPGVPNIPVPWTLEQLAPWILLAVVIVAITIFAVVTYKRRKPLPPKTPPLS
jgi:hypothetical protein